MVETWRVLRSGGVAGREKFGSEFCWLGAGGFGCCTVSLYYGFGFGSVMCPAKYPLKQRENRYLADFLTAGGVIV